MASLNSFCFTIKTTLASLIAISFGISQSKLYNPFFTSINDLCEMTLHPKTCYDSFTPLIDSKNDYDSQLLYNLSIKSSINEVSRASKGFSKNGTLYPILENTNENFLISVLESCRDLLSLAIYNLNWSLPTNASALTAHETRTNFRTWLSAAEADLETCKDGFQYAPSEVRNIVLENLDKSTKLVRNSLAIMCKIDDHIKSHEEPSYVDRIRSTKGKQHTSDHREPIWLSLEDKMLLHGSKQTMNPDVIVAADGLGNYTRMIDALNVVPLNSDLRFVIYVKKGIYYENVRVEKEKWNVMMFGDGMDNTIVSSNLSIASGTPTILTATFAAYGKGFIARDTGFQNTAGAAMYQAVALLSKSDQSVFYRCSIDAYQDTLYTQSSRQFYRECKINGTIDIIFGDSPVVIQNSTILVKRPLPGQISTITAQGRTNPLSNTGISIQNCTLLHAENLSEVQTFLGRPWKNYSTTIIMESQLGSLIDPNGWMPWGHNITAPDTIFYVEYNNTGPGAVTAYRVPWKGLRVNTDESDVSNFTVTSFVNGLQWLPATGVPFQPDL